MTGVPITPLAKLVIEGKDFLAMPLAGGGPTTCEGCHFKPGTRTCPRENNGRGSLLCTSFDEDAVFIRDTPKGINGYIAAKVIVRFDNAIPPTS